MSGPRVVVVGGGLAGTAAALECRRGGAEVILLESRGRLGGAVYSFRRDGLEVDNGQHVFLRCCTEYLRLLDELAARELVSLQPRLNISVLAPGGRRAVLARSGLPAPLHLAGSLLRYSLLSRRARVGVVRAMAALGRLDTEDPELDRRSFGAWLAAQGQGSEAVAALWELIARPTLNLTAENASLAQAAQVFQVGLLSASAAADVGHARVPLSEIHDVAARRALGAAGVEVRLRAGARSIGWESGGFQIEVSGSEPLWAERVIVAVPPERAAALLPPASGIDPARLQGLGSSPIVNLHVVYDRKVLDVPFAAAVHSPVQWVFDRTQSAGLERGQYLVVTLSAAEAELGQSPEQLRARYLPALSAVLGREANVENFFVTRDHAATFRAAPGARALRPSVRTAIPGLLLAGAWTDTGWPATMEGAVRSGRSAAREALGTRPAPPVLTPLRLEAGAVRAGAPGLEVQRIGMGPRRAAAAARRAARRGEGPVVLAGLAGALAPGLQPGDVVLASELIGSAGRQPCADPSLLAGVLRRGGLTVHVGPVLSTPRIVTARGRRRLSASGALAVDMESAAVARALGERPAVVLRVVLDTADHELHRPLRLARATRRALGALRQAAALLEHWTPAVQPREILLAGPRASCAGVERAVEIVERALEDSGPPVYVRKQIVHNAHVIAGLEQRGAVFVDEIDQVPEGATVIFSAHGVSPAVREHARARELRVIDATCPLVAKVHAEARRFSARGFDIVLVGHEGHEEVEGTFGEAPEHTHIVASAEEVGSLQVEDPARVAYLTQTTLAQDDTATVLDALRARFPDLIGPRSSDICYATQNRQDAVRAVAQACDVVLVIGSANSSNSRRLVEVAERAGGTAVLIEDAGEITPELVAGAGRVGITAGASAPEALVEGVVSALSGLGAVSVAERRVATEAVHFKLPADLRARSQT